MLADSKLPKRFWAEALSTAVYLQNRSPTKAAEGMTPFEAWTGEKPVKHLRIFGCAAYMLILPKMSGRSLIQKPESVFSWVMPERDTVSMTQRILQFCTVEIWYSTKESLE